MQEADVARELEAAKTRLQLRDAEKTLAQKQATHTRLAELYEQRRKWKAAWKVLQRTAEERDEAKAAMDTAQKDRDALASRYDQLAKDADAAVAKAQPSTSFGAAGEKHYVVAHAVLKGAGKTIELDAATPVDVRSVPVPRITGAELPITRATPLWQEIEGGTSAAAIERVRKRFSWHYAYVQAGPIKIGGMSLIPFAPVVFLPLLWVLIRRSRRVASGYNPFDRDAGVLPRVGLGGALNIVVLIVLPFAGTVLCARCRWWSCAKCRWCRCCVPPASCGSASPRTSRCATWSISATPSAKATALRRPPNAPLKASSLRRLVRCEHSKDQRVADSKMMLCQKKRSSPPSGRTMPSVQY